jgi:cysteine desulfurase / selenocysteine lyase
MIYLNNSATTFPKPQSVLDAVSQNISSVPVHSSRTGFERETDDYVYNCRHSLAKLFNISDPLQVIFTSGSTQALNLAIKGLDLKDKAHVITTKIEHNSVIRPLKHLEAEGKIEITFVDCDRSCYVSPEAIDAAFKPNTKLVVVNHCSNVTGSVLKIDEISKIAHAHGALFLVDASQSAGNLPIDFDGWDIDMLAFTGHKSLYGLSGTGGLLVKKGLDLKPLIVGGTGIKSEVLYQPDGFPIHYEAGTQNAPGIASLGAGVQFLFDTGLDKIRDHKVKLVKTMINELKNVPGITIYTSEENNAFSNFCFNIEGFVPEEVGYFLESSYDISVRTGLHCAPLLLEALGVHPWGTIRVSPSFFTTESETQQFIDAVKEISAIKNK